MKTAENDPEEMRDGLDDVWADEGMWLAARQWQTAFNAIGDAVCFLDPQGTILRCNVAMTRLAGKPFWEIVGCSCRGLLPCCGQAQDRPQPARKCPIARIRQSRSREVIRARVNDRWYHVVVDPVMDENGNFVGTVQVITDITERTQAQEKLRESEEKLRVMFESIADGVTVTDLNGDIVQLNEAAVRLHGYSCKEDLIGRRSAEFLSARSRNFALKKLRKVKEDGRSGVVEFTAVTREGNEFDAEMSAALLTDKSGKPAGFIAVTKDITERKQAHEELERSREELRSLSVHLQSVREEERTTIAREIHDELGQALTALKMDLAWIARRLPVEKEPLREKVRSMSGIVDNTIRAVKRISTELRPAILDHLGLAAAIEWQAEEFGKRCGMRCHLNLRMVDTDLEQDRATAVFRIFQESLTNIVRHARATSVRVTLEGRPGVIVLEVVDNGMGITEEQVQSSKSVGLIGMRERAVSMGGDVKIEGVPNVGTSVTLNMPFGKKRECR